ncbi:unnamed protein product [Brassicogethes aeneus]|uniref:CHK kinase-like domain-containing protein n=1 Tax=Brassicogethes aeneus TaxID=1431903 RepID=A0A9P0AYD1_BRAAE|nr:unnamed protein product [Brassicogethes aeneus]
MEKFGIERSDVISYIETVLQEQHVLEGKVNVTGTSSIGDGYTGLVIFIVATGKKYGKEVKLDFALKHSCALKEFREKIPIEFAYNLETLVLQKLVPLYQKILLENNCTPLKCFPKWYKTFESQNSNALVLENLKATGFVINDIKTPFTINHLNLLMKNYAKFHALGFAFKLRNPEKFKEISNEIIKLHKGIMEFCYELYKGWFKVLDNVLENCNETELLKKKRKITFEEVINLTDYVNDHSTIVHGDCWNNNYMFKMNGDTPEQVKILDWQICNVSNPLVDLCYVILANISQDNYEHIGDLLETYYKDFSENLRKLKCDPNEIYPKENFLGDYKKYARVSLMMVPSVLQISSKSKSELPDITKVDVDMVESFSNPQGEEVNEKILTYARYLEKYGII